jgi:hypothetical protein
VATVLSADARVRRRSDGFATVHSVGKHARAPEGFSCSGGRGEEITECAAAPEKVDTTTGQQPVEFGFWIEEGGGAKNENTSWLIQKLLHIFYTSFNLQRVQLAAGGGGG